MICPICQTNELADDRTSCIDCLITGRMMEFFLTEPVRGEILTKIRELSNVSTANLWPTLPGNFVLGVTLDDGRNYVGGWGVMQPLGEEASVAAFAPSIPELGEKWALVAGSLMNDDAEETPLVGVFDDMELVEAISSQ